MNVPVPEVSYPVCTIAVHVVPTPRVPVPATQFPASILYPLLRVLKAAGMSQSSAGMSHATPEKLLEHVQVVGEDAKTAVARAPLTASHAVQTPVKALVPADW